MVFLIKLEAQMSKRSAYHPILIFLLIEAATMYPLSVPTAPPVVLV